MLQRSLLLKCDDIIFVMFPLTSMSYLIYDCEIKKGILGRGEEKIDGIEYCNGWNDFYNMGISVIGVKTDAPGCKNDLVAFVDDKTVDEVKDLPFFIYPLSSFQALVDECAIIISFNGINFDDKLCAANDIHIKTTYDLLCEAFIASGQPPFYKKGITKAGYGLDNLAKAKFGRGKTGHGAVAPVQWQQGDYKEVIRYCLDDITLTDKLFDNRRHLIDPKSGDAMVCSGSPWASEAYYLDRPLR